MAENNQKLAQQQKEIAERKISLERRDKER